MLFDSIEIDLLQSVNFYWLTNLQN